MHYNLKNKTQPNKQKTQHLSFPAVISDRVQMKIGTMFIHLLSPGDRYTPEGEELRNCMLKAD